MKFSLTLIGTLALCQGQQLCDREVEVMLLQDATSSYYSLADQMTSSIKKMLAEMKELVGSVKTSVALFADKPTPFRGNGSGRGFVGVLDRCYMNDNTYALGDDEAQLSEGYDAVFNNNCEGGDYPEDPLEAMLYAAQDPKINWSPASRMYTADAKRIVKILVTVTDDHPHYAGDGAAGITAWNPQLPGVDDHYPHFFDSGFIDLGAIYNQADNAKVYARVCELHKKSSLTQEETVELQKGLEQVGPGIYSELLPHPGTFEASKECEKYEYPTLEQVGEVLNREKIFPIILVSGQNPTNTGRRLCKQRGFDVVSNADWLDCLVNVYRKDLQDAKIEKFIVEPYGNNADELIAQLSNVVDKLSKDVSCPATTPVPIPDTTTTIEPTPVPTTEPPTEDTSRPTEEPSNETSGTGSTEPGTTGSETGSRTQTSSSSGVPPIVPIAPAAGGSSNTAVIAGASGGSIAGVAAIGGLLYKKFGASLLGGNSTPDLGAVEQVEVPETPVEREAFEEVTMDMFQ